ncbi:hypothetical protein L2520_01235 [Limosilactobacillus vaginalis]|uniref:Amidohydrolase-related domain-containing protein n=1 Tax=Limosilactobacillus vaginalis TaxID=1633 RepID=A0ABT4K542_9LACO|nr:hypothetical protein [Limosilactobacillus vaginalis]MCZ3746033.1 hypothetical protein [Limosilactobacillus vaginalis]MCZ3751015.1 hypothetical protein [Limosilactobacillus vaginalis]MCZ3752740.1 hypothetical protein [Limosilactobacillus vaginalis]MCZ3754464.1 hypothetical protein [Limosilactobacillus vaginalis]MCZ3756187.1 hypothetical protein [Limosilactobacillus vaginalis]
MKKIALEEHFSTPESTKLWNDNGEASRNGKSYTEFVKNRLWADIDDYIDELNRLDIDHVVMSLTSPGVQGINDKDTAVKLAFNSNNEAYQHYVEGFPYKFSFLPQLHCRIPKKLLLRQNEQLQNSALRES